MKLRNKYYLLRHGEAVSNVRQIVSSWPEKFKNPLTKHGKEMIIAVAEILKDNHQKHGKAIDLIFASDLLRTRQTAQIVAKELNLPLKFDTRLREIQFGVLNGRPAEELLYMGFEKERQKKRLKRSETYGDVLKRIWTFLKDIDKHYDGKNILLVSHQSPLWILENKVKGFTLAEGLKRIPEEKRIGKGELRELN